MRAYEVTLVPGDGSGPELVDAARSVLDHAARLSGFKIDWDVHQAGQRALAESESLLPDATLNSIRTNGAALKGPTTTPIGTGHRSVNITIRQELDLYACLRPVRSLPIASTQEEPERPHIDLVVVRENTEDVYAGLEYPKGSPGARAVVQALGALGRPLPADTAVSLKPFTPHGCERVVEFAFNHAARHGRKLVESVCDARRYPATEGMFARVASKVAARHPSIASRTVPVPALCADLVRAPGRHDVLVLPNLYGDIISDVTAALVGSLGVAPGANIGAHHAVFEATHGSAPEFAGSGRLNPTALIFSGCMLLDHLGEHETAARIRAAVEDVVAAGKVLTFDLLAPQRSADAATTVEFTRAVTDRLGPVARP
ncbi:isocitrate/isopropylmalate dehydrogenase family protein [Streptomyces parvus]|uniref:isocitrate/isopropylmalate dehydrogenase family protein n=1 Tax=Streptomyces parvus TaxID=66428 RepID=UPI0035D9F9C5